MTSRSRGLGTRRPAASWPTLVPSLHVHRYLVFVALFVLYTARNSAGLSTSNFVAWPEPKSIDSLCLADVTTGHRIIGATLASDHHESPGNFVLGVNEARQAFLVQLSGRPIHGLAVAPVPHLPVTIRKVIVRESFALALLEDGEMHLWGPAADSFVLPSRSADIVDVHVVSSSIALLLRNGTVLGLGGSAASFASRLASERVVELVSLAGGLLLARTLEGRVFNNLFPALEVNNVQRVWSTSDIAVLHVSRPDHFRIASAHSSSWRIVASPFGGSTPVKVFSAPVAGVPREVLVTSSGIVIANGVEIGVANDIALSGTTVALLSANQTVSLYDLAAGAGFELPFVPDDTIDAVLASDQHFLLVSSLGSGYMLDPGTGTVLENLGIPTGANEVVSFSDFFLPVRANGSPLAGGWVPAESSSPLQRFAELLGNATSCAVLRASDGLAAVCDGRLITMPVSWSAHDSIPTCVSYRVELPTRYIPPAVDLRNSSSSGRYSVAASHFGYVAMTPSGDTLTDIGIGMEAHIPSNLRGESGFAFVVSGAVDVLAVGMDGRIGLLGQAARADPKNLVDVDPTALYESATVISDAHFTFARQRDGAVVVLRAPPENTLAEDLELLAPEPSLNFFSIPSELREAVIPMFSFVSVYANLTCFWERKASGDFEQHLFDEAIVAGACSRSGACALVFDSGVLLGRSPMPANATESEWEALDSDIVEFVSGADFFATLGADGVARMWQDFSSSSLFPTFELENVSSVAGTEDYFATLSTNGQVTVADASGLAVVEFDGIASLHASRASFAMLTHSHDLLAWPASVNFSEQVSALHSNLHGFLAETALGRFVPFGSPVMDSQTPFEAQQGVVLTAGYAFLVADEDGSAATFGLKLAGGGDILVRSTPQPTVATPAPSPFPTENPTTSNPTSSPTTSPSEPKTTLDDVSLNVGTLAWVVTVTFGSGLAAIGIVMALACRSHNRRIRQRVRKARLAQTRYNGGYSSGPVYTRRQPARTLDL